MNWKEIDKEGLPDKNEFDLLLYSRKYGEAVVGFFCDGEFDIMDYSMLHIKENITHYCKIDKPNEV